jgi:hypothetical protein
MNVGDARGFDETRVANNNFSPFRFRLNNTASHDRVGVCGVIAEDKNALGIFNLND